ncbi:hypothetical protein P170DRAFT_440729 [Aspergillus steynii IBT 23096]|uniref:Uncharacterized protein n=1 Tax=Aspergillus steynii IBT 23096 TaxID=1392250 RepID=A0A2I2FV20_9EURO|nr:uncharacterized protein P170DRAFT_440729 [Aspergillus steynii IBT 23096]PLB44447.1 hypothetical protein P170DRAFT_440729 [Aspergillus steynii IBT 23096]
MHTASDPVGPPDCLPGLDSTSPRTPPNRKTQRTNGYPSTLSISKAPNQRSPEFPRRYA